MTHSDTKIQPQSGHSDTLTEGVRVVVGAQYHPDQSRPEIGRHFFSYRVILSNEGERRVRLLTRHWLIRDADNVEREVDGPGVVGEHPDLGLGCSFEYESACTLATEWGTMEGWFQMEFDDGEAVRVPIGRFFLAPNTAPLTQLGGRASRTTRT